MTNMTQLLRETGVFSRLYNMHDSFEVFSLDYKQGLTTGINQKRRLLPFYLLFSFYREVILTDYYRQCEVVSPQLKPAHTDYIFYIFTLYISFWESH